MSDFIQADQFCNAVKDGTHDSPQKTEQGVKLVTSKNIIGGRLDLSSAYFISDNDAIDVNKRSKVDVNDILISMIGTVGEVCLIDTKPNFVIKNVGLLKLDNPIKAKWLYFYLTSKDAQKTIRERLRGTTQQYLPLGELRKLPILLPKNDQHMLNTVSFLSAINDKIQLNTQTNQTLEAIAQAIFKSWFVDFDPVRAKAQAILDGKTRDEANLSAMSVISGKAIEELSQTEYRKLWQIADAFPSELVENSEFGEVPKGWEIVPLSTFGEIICGKTPTKSKAEYYGNDIPFIKIPDMHGKVFITQTIDNLSLIGADSQTKKYIPKGSICVSCIATVGLVSLASRKSQTNQQINSIIPNDLNFSEYLYLYLSQSEINKYMKNLASGGSATLNMNTSTFSSIEILKPNNEILHLFHKKSLDIFEKILKNEESNQILAQTRDLLLPKLLSGEIKL